MQLVTLFTRIFKSDRHSGNQHRATGEAAEGNADFAALLASLKETCASIDAPEGELTPGQAPVAGEINTPKKVETTESAALETQPAEPDTSLIESETSPQVQQTPYVAPAIRELTIEELPENAPATTAAIKSESTASREARAPIPTDQGSVDVALRKENQVAEDKQADQTTTPPRSSRRTAPNILRHDKNGLPEGKQQVTGNRPLVPREADKSEPVSRPQPGLEDQTVKTGPAVRQAVPAHVKAEAAESPSNAPVMGADTKKETPSPSTHGVPRWEKAATVIDTPASTERSSAKHPAAPQTVAKEHAPVAPVREVAQENKTTKPAARVTPVSHDIPEQEPPRVAERENQKPNLRPDVPQPELRKGYNQEAERTAQRIEAPKPEITRRNQHEAQGQNQRIEAPEQEVKPSGESAPRMSQTRPAVSEPEVVTVEEPKLQTLTVLQSEPARQTRPEIAPEAEKARPQPDRTIEKAPEVEIEKPARSTDDHEVSSRPTNVQNPVPEKPQKIETVKGQATPALPDEQLPFTPEKPAADEHRPEKPALPGQIATDQVSELPAKETRRAAPPVAKEPVRSEKESPREINTHQRAEAKTQPVSSENANTGTTSDFGEKPQEFSFDVEQPDSSTDSSLTQDVKGDENRGVSESSPNTGSSTAARSHEASRPAAMVHRGQAMGEWIRSLLQKNVGQATIRNGWNVLEIKLEGDDGSVTIRTRREEDRMAVAVGFTDPQLRAIAQANMAELKDVLQAHFASDVDFSLSGEGSDGQNPREQSSGAGPSGPSQETTGRSEARRARVALPGSSREWIG